MSPDPANRAFYTTLRKRLSASHTLALTSCQRSNVLLGFLPKRSWTSQISKQLTVPTVPTVPLFAVGLSRPLQSSRSSRLNRFQRIRCPASDGVPKRSKITLSWSVPIAVIKLASHPIDHQTQCKLSLLVLPIQKEACGVRARLPRLSSMAVATMTKCRRNETRMCWKRLQIWVIASEKRMESRVFPMLPIWRERIAGRSRKKRASILQSKVFHPLVSTAHSFNVCSPHGGYPPWGFMNAFQEKTKVNVANVASENPRSRPAFAATLHRCNQRTTCLSVHCNCPASAASTCFKMFQRKDVASEMITPYKQWQWFVGL